jgi:hypothetical protein
MAGYFSQPTARISSNQVESNHHTAFEALHLRSNHHTAIYPPPSRLKEAIQEGKAAILEDLL